MTEFRHEPETTRPSYNGGVQHLFQFDNGYGASVIMSPSSYGGDAGLWELAVLDAEGELCYDTPITDDVIGWQSEDQIADLLDRIAAL